MQNRTLLGALLLGLALGSYALTDTPAAKEGAPKPAADAQRIDELIKQLGSAKFQERDAASKELEAIGVPAVEALKKAAKTEDLETSKRAAELVRRLEDRAFTASLLAPKRVRLKVNDMPALDAVNELAKISGYAIQVQGDRTKLTDKKVTLDTGEVAFWEALDQLCAKAGLVEQVQQVNQFPGLRVEPVRPIGPPIQIQVPPQKGAPKADPPKVEPRPVDKAPIEKAPIEKVPAEKAPLEKAPEKKAAPQPAPQAVKELKPEAAAPVQVRAQAAQVQAARVQAQPVQAEAKPVQIQAQPVQAQPVQVQIQVQGQPVQIQPFPLPTPGGRPGQINLVPGTPQKEPTSYAGSVRVRVVPGAQSVAKGEYVITLDVAAEPRLQGFTVVGTPSLDKIIDDQGQKLAVATDPAPANPQGNPIPGGIRNVPFDIVMPGRVMTGQRRVSVRVKAGEKEAKSLKELSGTVTAQVMGPPETLLSLDNVLKAAGQTAKDKSGGSLQLNSIEKMENGDYKAQLQLVSPQGQNPFGGAVFGNGVIQMQQVQIQVGGFGGAGGGLVAPGIGNAAGMPELLDAKGNKFQIVQIPARRMNINNGQASQDLTLVFRGGKDHGEPARLVVTGTRQVALTIPFRFENVPLNVPGAAGVAPAGVAPAGVAPAGVAPGAVPGAVDVPLPPAPARPPQ